MRLAYPSGVQAGGDIGGSCRRRFRASRGERAGLRWRIAERSLAFLSLTRYNLDSATSVRGKGRMMFFCTPVSNRCMGGSDANLAVVVLDGVFLARFLHGGDDSRVVGVWGPQRRASGQCGRPMGERGVVVGMMLALAYLACH